MKQHASKCASLKGNLLPTGNTVYPECDCDGYHTFTELYDHRITLYIALCRVLANVPHETDMPQCWCNPRREVVENGNMVIVHNAFVWRSKKHWDGELCFGTGTQFVLGIGADWGKQITYHIPIERWDETEFAETFDVAPKWDRHTSDDVIERLKTL